MSGRKGKKQERRFIAKPREKGTSGKNEQVKQGDKKNKTTFLQHFFLL